MEKENILKGKQLQNNDNFDLKSLLMTSEFKWSDVIGLEKEKNLLKSAIMKAINSQQSPKIQQSINSILVYGAPGVGKTFLLKTLSNQIKELSFYAFHSSEIVSRHRSNCLQLVQFIFKQAKSNKPSLIFIDEIDCIFESKVESLKQVVTQILLQMNQIRQDNNKTIFLFATSYPQRLPLQFIKSLTSSIYIDLPSSKQRYELIRRQSKKSEHSLQEEDCIMITKQTEHFSYSDILMLIRCAAYEPVNRLMAANIFKKLENGKYTNCLSETEQGQLKSWQDFDANNLQLEQVTMQDYINSLKCVRPTIGPELLKKYVDFTLIHQNATMISKLIG